MIGVSVAELEAAAAQVLLRPVCADWSAVTPAMRRLELAAGSALREQCLRLGDLPVGSAVITGAGQLAAEYMVHAVVRAGDEPPAPAMVRNALVNGLRRLVELEIESVAMAPLGTGAGNLEVERAADIMVSVLLEHYRSERFPAHVRIVVDADYERDVFEQRLRRHGLHLEGGKA